MAKAKAKQKPQKHTNMEEICRYAAKTKRFIGGMGVLKKDGSITKINGNVKKFGVTKNGEEYIILDNLLHPPRKDGTRWQMVLLENLTTLNENGWKHTKK